MGIDELPKKRKAGKPPVKLADTFDEAMAVLTPIQRDFVRHLISGKTAREAYRATHPNAILEHSQRRKGSALARHKSVAHALSLAKKAGALQAITGIKYDIAAAHTEINEHIQTAIKQENMNAVASLVREKLKLHRLTDQPPAAMAGASFTLIIRGQDGNERTINPAHVVDIQPLSV